MNVSAGNSRILSADQLESIDLVCTQFEAQWHAGKTPEIEQLVQDQSEPVRSALLGELVKLEIDYLRKARQTPLPHEYDLRFPQDPGAVAEAFSAGNGQSEDEQGSVVQEQSMSPEAPVQTLNLVAEYEIEAFHARGGLGEIYRAKDRNLDRHVAVKFPRNRDLNSADHQRLQREAEITSRLKHPGIVSVHAVNQNEDELPCYVMQFIQGQTFREAVVAFHSKSERGGNSKFRSWEFRQLLQRLVTVGNTVAYAHQQGVIHRDIKPSNIMLGQFGETFLLDWGLAKILECNELEKDAKPINSSERKSWPISIDETPEATRPGQAIGTPEFASPEQVMGRIEDHDARSDVYSLGATLYFLLLGKRAVELEDLTNLETASALKKIQAPSMIDPGVPVDLDAICMKAISFEAADRYDQVVDFKNDIERYLADESINARKPSLRARLRRWASKNPRWASGLATGILVTVVALSISAWMLGQKNVELGHSNKALTGSNEQLRTSRQNTMSVLRTMTDRVVSEFLSREEFLEEQELELMQLVLDEFQSFAHSMPDEESAVQIELEAYYRVAQIQNLLGKEMAARESLEKAIELSAALPEPQTTPNRRLVADSYRTSGTLLFKLGEIDRGIQRIQSAIEQFDQLQIEFPADPDFTFRAARAHSALGVVYVETRKFKQAEAEFLAAELLLEEPLNNDPANSEFLAALADVCTNLGIVYSGPQDFDRAIEKLELAIELHEKLKGLNADRFDIPFQRVKTYLALANVWMRRKEYDQAMPLFDIAIAESRQLIATYPNVTQNFITLSRAHASLGQIHLYRDSVEQSVLHNVKSVEAAEEAVRMSPELRKYVYTLFTSRMSLAVALRLNNEFEASAKQYEKCLASGRQLLEEHSSLIYRVGNARAHYAYGILKLKQDQLTDAIVQFENSVNLLEQATEKEKPQKLLRGLWKTASNELAFQLIQADRNTEAVRHWDRVIELTEGNTNFPGSVRAVCLADATPLDALAEVESVLENDPNSANVFYNLASASARAARFMDPGEPREAAKTQAIELLQTAREAGYFKNQAKIGKFKTNNSFYWMRKDTRLESFTDQLDHQEGESD